MSQATSRAKPPAPMTAMRFIPRSFQRGSNRRRVRLGRGISSSPTMVAGDQLLNRTLACGGSLKPLHCRLPLLTDPFSLHDLDNRRPQDLEIKPHSLIVHIPDVQIELFFPPDCIPA